METLKILFSGDWCIRGAGCNILDNDAILSEIASKIKAKTSEYDASIVNVETVFSDTLSPTKKSGPNIATPTKGLDFLKSMGFTIGAMANNHVCDHGDQAGLKSKDMIDNTGMLTLGYGKNIDEARKSIRMEIKGTTISFLNFAENEFVAATESTPGFAPIDYFDNARQVREEKEKSDFVFVMLHAGNEFCPFPRNGVKKLCHTLVESGADGVIVAHPHCPQGMEYYKNKPIAYSTGNFFMSKEKAGFSTWNVGYMAEVIINTDKSVTLNPIPYEFDNYLRYFDFMSGERKDIFLKYLDTLSAIITDTSDAEYQNLLYAWSIMYIEDMKGFIDEHRKDLTFDGEFMLYIKNAFSCESHNELMTNYFKIHTTGRLKEFDEYIKKIKNWQVVPLEERK